MAQSSSASGTSSRRHLREHDASSPGSPRYADSEWESKEAILHRELDEAKARAAQMEKTMRWWSDCTANWREKWCEVRDERNKAKKEAKILKSKLEAAMKDLNAYKQESRELETQNTQLKKEMEKVHMILLKHAGQFDQQLISVLDSDPQLKSALGVDELLDVYNNIEQTGNITPSSSKKEFSTCKSPPTAKDSIDGRSSLDKDIEEYILQGAVPKHTVEHKDTSPTPQEKRHSRIDSANEEALMQKMSMLNLRLEEATKTISAEREEKSSLHRGMEKLRMEILTLRERCEELQDSRTEAMKELLELKGRFQGELSAAQADLIDEATNREGMDRRLSELRAELEKLQAENAAEWGKRERLETEKISLERENKQLRSELRDLQDRVERKSRPVSSCDADSKQLQQELLDRNKELVDLKHSHAKLKKMLAEKTTELSHASRRSEQYEAEVKRIRARVEELKKELALAQDEVDAANNSIRRLQRANEDLTEQLENTSTQLEHYRNSISESRAPDVVAEIMDDKTRDDDDDEEDEIADGKNC
ncbi:coiled-coil domain-containing protein 102A [Nasonia vitripennis]|uniref:Coiled-coil domain-containing protein 102A n=1 Tax=Nasonia vitripennis TaxID=7425 RepID=A0A7M7GAE9_NASVI|nr:coiled-coil domain-containing protein 102A [Nasonia vitripennis]